MKKDEFIKNLQRIISDQALTETDYIAKQAANSVFSYLISVDVLPPLATIQKDDGSIEQRRIWE